MLEEFQVEALTKYSMDSWYLPYSEVLLVLYDYMQDIYDIGKTFQRKKNVQAKKKYPTRGSFNAQEYVVFRRDVTRKLLGVKQPLMINFDKG